MADTPCINICNFDGQSGQCEGCGRTRAEIAGWRKLSPYQRRAIERDLPRRTAKIERHKSRSSAVSGRCAGLKLSFSRAA